MARLYASSSFDMLERRSPLDTLCRVVLPFYGARTVALALALLYAACMLVSPNVVFGAAIATILAAAACALLEARLWREVARFVVDSLPSTAAEREREWRRFFVAEDETGEICGMISLQKCGAPTDGATDDTAELCRLCVKPEHRRRGIASALVRYAEQFARGKFKRVVLTTSSLVAARDRLYADALSYQLAATRAATRDFATPIMLYTFEKDLAGDDKVTRPSLS